MQKLLRCILTGFITIFSFFNFAQCDEEATERILMVGDSWAFFMNVDRTINNVLRDWGHTDKRYYTNGILSENGARITDFFSPEKQNEIETQLLNRPSIDYVHLSIGGNDVLGNWKLSFSQHQVDSLKDKVLGDLVQIIDFIKSVKPGIKILWSGYVYTNFQEVIEGFLFPSNHPFHGTWSGMEFPNNETINQILIDFSEQIEAYFADDDQVDFYSVPGLMQYTFGQNNALGVAPFGTYPAFTAPLPYGYPEYPSPQNSMRDYALTKDCFHLSAKGYYDLISYHTQKYYHKELMDEFAILQPGNTSGTISTDNEVSADFFFGNNNGVAQYPLFHFDTQQFTISTIKRASIYLHLKDEIGTNPFSENFEIRLKSGYFGATPTLEAGDVMASASISGAGCVFGNLNNGNWVRVDLPLDFFPYLQQAGSVEFIFATESNGLVEISGTEDSEFAPVLEIQFGANTVGLQEEIVAAPSPIECYPNPTSGKVKIQINGTASLNQVQCFNTQGAIVLETNESEIDLSHLPSGIYLAKVVLDHTVVTKRIVKH